ncbi:MAG: ATPase [Candidatus Raymondbacteria bacterium RifOxyA12_full_50_37]|uniref:ATPase n=1 Tax=Candidatus Raymondbacteria bacterium RIFOXYD12_FULL_49_13 TaxID=1817890 RepID=A0A1F7FAV9_UNCRA|nr:MAG: ATPase [Candidatus Raymondbacteria bacterium RifOxyA12_full_50_37]OGJ92626.1 MAG: ATPase [Candidatus Raymondbacteria bacterium RIFOXYA2_FULL_49_16]OGJ97980.1 MAG: ATPase [Candidatus Raymondbacteria bacterium RIFOXYC2_FULL_50_21]OGJ98633.1 MAG: ATPase [Candidatus Raymondbacteria bacterium RifOxyC12_full_50_8]OGK00121.1 MAG: ATPase [Candidatus Raymondbacteria bacterium RifOxyB12_full_50_8]OGK03758.1 MAG: ATPase [Candidatus Raymondbacteria bacterium RIFOXYD12_FULL_49_13]OGP44865.1 MAG: A
MLTASGIGLGLMIGLSAAGSAIGLSISGQALMGMLKKRPEAFGIGLVLSAAPSTQGLYGFVAYMLYKSIITPDLTAVQGAVVLAAGIMVGIACLLSAIFQGKVCASGLAAFSSGHNVVAQTLILAAFPEFYAILSLVAAILMKGLMAA